MPLEYSDRAIIGYSELFRSFNAKTVFIEDENGETAYRRMLNRILGSDDAIFRVFPLKGRDPLIGDWRKNSDNDDFIYIVDGDLNLILEGDISQKNLLSLDRYSIENFLIDKSSITEVISDYCRAGPDVQKLADELEMWISETASAFGGLFVLFAISHDHKLGIPNVSEGAMRYLTRNGVDKCAIYARKKEFMALLQSTLGREAVRAARRRIAKDLDHRSLPPEHYVSGKDHLFPIVHKFFEWKAGYSGRPFILFNQLARHARFDTSSGFGKKLAIALTS